ncbi:hypothetical protein [Streptomyces sp. NPDC000878]
MRIIERDDGPIVAVLDVVTPKLRLQPCVCGGVEHQVADRLERSRCRLWSA